MKKTALTRRQFVSSAFAGLAASSLVGTRAFGASQNSTDKAGIDGMQLAIATLCTDGFGNHRHEPAFRVIPELGFKNVEFNLWYPNLLVPSYIESIRQRCYETGLNPISLQGTGFGGEGRNGVIKDLSHKIQLLNLCKILGCRIVKCTGARRGTQGGIQAVIDVCKELAPVAEDMGMTVVLENHANNVLENIGDYEAVFAAIDSPNIGMCLDTGHFEGVSVDLHEVIDTFHDRILHVDLKDCKERGKGHDTVVFGQGVTDFDSFLSHLREKNYEGYLVVEQAWSEPKGDWVNDLKDAYDRFRKWEQ